MKLRHVLLALCVAAVTGSAALAHPQHGLAGERLADGSLAVGGLAAGFLHPWLGIDHLLAMIAVGLLSVQIGGRALWILPLSFLGLMIAGGAIGISGLDLPLVEFGIALSVVALGAALVIGSKYPLAATAVVVGAFGLMHGYAHGIEMPAMAAPALYAAGFVAATALLHLAGIACGLAVAGRQRWSIPLRLSGAAISAAGVVLFCGLI